MAEGAAGDTTLFQWRALTLTVIYMANGVWHTKYGIEINLTRADLGNPGREGLLEEITEGFQSGPRTGDGGTVSNGQGPRAVERGV